MENLMTLVEEFMENYFFVNDEGVWESRFPEGPVEDDLNDLLTDIDNVVCRSLGEVDVDDEF